MDLETDVSFLPDIPLLNATKNHLQLSLPSSPVFFTSITGKKGFKCYHPDLNHVVPDLFKWDINIFS